MDGPDEGVFDRLEANATRPVLFKSLPRRPRRLAQKGQVSQNIVIKNTSPTPDLRTMSLSERNCPRDGCVRSRWNNGPGYSSGPVGDSFLFLPLRAIMWYLLLIACRLQRCDDRPRRCRTRLPSLGLGSSAPLPGLARVATKRGLGLKP